MAQININIRMDENLKRDFDGLCNDLGFTMTAAVKLLPAGELLYTCLLGVAVSSFCM